MPTKNCERVVVGGKFRGHDKWLPAWKDSGIATFKTNDEVFCELDRAVWRGAPRQRWLERPTSLATECAGFTVDAHVAFMIPDKTPYIVWVGGHKAFFRVAVGGAEFYAGTWRWRKRTTDAGCARASVRQRTGGHTDLDVSPSPQIAHTGLLRPTNSEESLKKRETWTLGAGLAAFVAIVCAELSGVSPLPVESMVTLVTAALGMSGIGAAHTVAAAKIPTETNTKEDGS